MLAQEQSRLEAFQRAHATYSEFLRRRGAGGAVSFEELLSRHPELDELLRGLHETYCRGGQARGGQMHGVQPGGDERAAARAVSGATTVVDRRGSAEERRLREAAARGGSLRKARGQRGRSSAAAARPPDAAEARTSRIDADERYVPQGELARGGMGAILKVWDRDLGRTLAMKVLLDEEGSVEGSLEGSLEGCVAGSGDGPEREPRSPPRPPGVSEDLLGRFLQEAQVIAGLDHPGVVPIHDVGFDLEGRPYFTMRFVDGLDLESVFDLARGDRDGWNLSRAVASIVKTCQTVAYAHRKGIIHRDLKPANVMVGRFGEVYVIDWGLAKPFGRATRGENSEDTIAPPGEAVSARDVAPPSKSPRSSIDSAAGVVVGTPPYMSPEQADATQQAIGPRSDIYSLGAILYRLLTRDAPYAPRDGRTLTPPEMTDRVLKGPPTPVLELDPDAPADLVAICERAMAREPSRRYESALDMAEELQSYLDGCSVHTPGWSPAARFKDWLSGNRVSVGLAGVAVFLLALLSGLAAFSSGTDDRGPTGRRDPHHAVREADSLPPSSEPECSVVESQSGCRNSENEEKA